MTHFADALLSALVLLVWFSPLLLLAWFGAALAVPRVKRLTAASPRGGAE